MTEKKYMTASEFLIKHNVIEKKGKYFGITDGLVGDHTNKINKLDSKFIDREELKDKIKLLGHKWELKVINNYNIDTPRDLYIVDFTKEILEMLK